MPTAVLLVQQDVKELGMREGGAVLLCRKGIAVLARWKTHSFIYAQVNCFKGIT